MQRYDYIMAGAGAAGLSLAYHLAQTPLRDKAILLVDKAPKTDNDRTWCFWERGDGPFERVVCRQWQDVYFHGAGYDALMDLDGYRYKMIRAGDFYPFVRRELEGLPNVHWVYGDITAVRDEPDGASVVVDGETYAGNWLFDSRFGLSSLARQPGRHYLLQHFKGWEVEVDRPVFDPAKATLMDFRIEQHGETRFFYVLPFDERRALVEFTVFSADLLTDAYYEGEVARYLREFLGLDAYRVLHKEFGVIPMTDHPFPVQRGRHVILTGTAGGQTKASTGYTFRRIQQHSKALADALLTTGRPHVTGGFKGQFALYDSMLLNVMARNRYPIKEIFTLLFQKNPPARILKFLDEDTSFAEDLQIMSTTPYAPFLAALWDVVRQRVKA
jgi:lycopene beta-cyclase